MVSGFSSQSGEFRSKTDWALVAYLTALVVLLAGSRLRVVGDGGEYLAMTQAFARFEGPRAAELYPHFWFFSLLATMWVPLARFLQIGMLGSFALLDLSLLILAFIIVKRELSPAAALFLFLGPIIWWIDKPHTEAFTFALLAIAFALAERAPHYAVLALAAAATQNPPIALLIPVLGVLTIIKNRALPPLRTWWVYGLACGVVLLHPAYYMIQVGRASVLSNSAHKEVPVFSEVVVPLWDANLGLLPNFPFFLPMVVATGWALAASRRLTAFWVSLVLSVAALAIFLASFAQTTNFNHGGTPGMSRYALWLIPLAIPLLRGLSVAGPRIRSLCFALTVATAIFCFFVFHPSFGEPRGPSRFARAVWTDVPWLDNPLPEVFIERLRRTDGRYPVPTATDGCEKVLLVGREGDVFSEWPMSCPPAPIREIECRQGGTLCYANRVRGGYSLAPAFLPRAGAPEFERERAWSRRDEDNLLRLLRRVPRWDMSIVRSPLPHTKLAEIPDADLGYSLEGPNVLMVFIVHPDSLAVLSLRLPPGSAGEFIDIETGQRAGFALRDASNDPIWKIPIPQGHEKLAFLQMAGDTTN